ncbi:hypothetical protein, partial [Klebsiella pneumoniae]|uniref:hypothetical protein n=1 Tax=Klebsiella pneumoniae TaxID=573 RepID=UPI003B58CE66
KGPKTKKKKPKKTEMYKQKHERVKKLAEQRAQFNPPVIITKNRTKKSTSRMSRNREMRRPG